MSQSKESSMIDFPHPEFARALKLANRATRRGDVRAATRWLRLAEHHMKLYRTYHSTEDESIEREAAEFQHLAKLPVLRVKTKPGFTFPTGGVEGVDYIRWRPGRSRGS
jgi:hypothetical protein